MVEYQPTIEGVLESVEQLIYLGGDNLKIEIFNSSKILKAIVRCDDGWTDDLRKLFDPWINAVKSGPFFIRSSTVAKCWQNYNSVDIEDNPELSAQQFFMVEEYEIDRAIGEYVDASNEAKIFEDDDDKENEPPTSKQKQGVKRKLDFVAIRPKRKCLTKYSSLKGMDISSGVDEDEWKEGDEEDDGSEVTSSDDSGDEEEEDESDDEVEEDDEEGGEDDIENLGFKFIDWEACGPK